MKALGFRLAGENEPLCACCYRKIFHAASPFTCTLISLTKTASVKGGALCPDCGKPYLRDDTLQAAHELTKKLEE
jgi:hypothetical protein